MAYLTSIFSETWHDRLISADSFAVIQFIGKQFVYSGPKSVELCYLCWTFNDQFSLIIVNFFSCVSFRVKERNTLQNLLDDSETNRVKCGKGEEIVPLQHYASGRQDTWSQPCIGVYIHVSRLPSFTIYLYSGIILFLGESSRYENQVFGFGKSITTPGIATCRAAPRRTQEADR